MPNTQLQVNDTILNDSIETEEDDQIHIHVKEMDLTNILKLMTILIIIRLRNFMMIYTCKIYIYILPLEFWCLIIKHNDQHFTQ